MTKKLRKSDQVDVDVNDVARFSFFFMFFSFFLGEGEGQIKPEADATTTLSPPSTQPGEDTVLLTSTQAPATTSGEPSFMGVCLKSVPLRYY